MAVGTSENPFKIPNAKELSVTKVLKFWCDPTQILLRGVESIDTLFSERAIFLEGSRGCGKTMALRYLSHPVQMLEAQENSVTFIRHAQHRGSIGFYTRLDEASLGSFSNDDDTEQVKKRNFAHYLELTFCHEFVGLIVKLIRGRHLRPGAIPRRTIELVAERFGLATPPTSLQGLLETARLRVAELDTYRATRHLPNTEFTPARFFGPGDLILPVTETLGEQVRPLAGIRFLVMIDEFERFRPWQQQMINSLVRSQSAHVGFRIGMRHRGLKTNSTLSGEGLREGRDYRLIKFQDTLAKDRRYRQFLVEMASRRLKDSGPFMRSKLTDIRQILGKENDVTEAVDIADSRRSHSEHFKLLPEPTRTRALAELRCPENPLIELMCIVWLLRGSHSFDETKQALDGFLAARSPDGRRLRSVPAPARDSPAGLLAYEYVHKYKLSLLFLLANCFHQPKKYYGFNIFAFLSSGIPGTFVNLCYEAFSLAAYEGTGSHAGEHATPISRDIQTAAARNRAVREYDYLASPDLPDAQRYGRRLQTLARNLLIDFRRYHVDTTLRYPERNTFAVNRSTLSSEQAELLDAAMTLSLILVKNPSQRAGRSGGLTEVLTLNRVLSPLYNISYRTRGGEMTTYDSVGVARLASVQSTLNSNGAQKRNRLD